MTIDELKALVSVGTWTDSALSILLDGAVDFIFSLLGHSFGRAIRIYHSEEEDATVATVSVTATAIVLVITGGANAGTHTYLFSTYSTIVSLVNAIEQEDVGFVASLVEGINPSEPSSNLHTLDATSCLGLSNRVVLCISQMTEVFDGLNEPMIFTTLPIQSVVSVVQDGTTITDFWEKSAGYIIYKYADGSQYSPYTMDLWSTRSPCNISCTYVPKFLRIPGVIKLILRAICEHQIISTGVKAESIGDYAVTYGEFEKILAPWWPMIAQYSINFSL